MPTAMETPKRRLKLAAPPERHVGAWRSLLGLDRGKSKPWPVFAEELRYTATSNHPLRPTGANTDVWKRVMAVRGDSQMTVADRRLLRLNTAIEAPPTVDEYIAWLDSEDFGPDPERMRREAWH